MKPPPCYLKLVLLIPSLMTCASGLVCPDPKPLGCPEIVCKLINSRQTDFCKDVQCDGMTAESCRPTGTTYVRNLTMCGCCSGCAKYLEVGDACKVSPPDPSPDMDCTDEYCPILMNRCGPGLVCNYLGGSSGKCAIDSSSGGSSDTLDCEDKRTLYLTDRLHWNPRCELDGSYAPKQCKGTAHDGLCFCVNANGDRIFGQQWWSQSGNQTCGCSRRVHDLRAEGSIATFHCSSDGNYEPLQCDTDSGLCYCVDPKDGKLIGGVLPEHLWTSLPCYSPDLNGDITGQYLRICESEWAAGERLKREGSLHGVHGMAAKDLNCDYDGSYAPVHRAKAEWYCVDKIGTLSGHHMMLNQTNMNCQCYRDAIWYSQEGRAFSYTCDLLTGNYDMTATFDEVKDSVKCVDRDGKFFGDEAPRDFVCCLLGDCSGRPSYVREKCNNTPDPISDTYRSCSLLPT